MLDKNCFQLIPGIDRFPWQILEPQLRRTIAHHQIHVLCTNILCGIAYTHCHLIAAQPTCRVHARLVIGNLAWLLELLRERFCSDGI